MKQITIVLIILSGLVLNSCEAWYPCLEGNGVLSVEERGITNFTSIYSNSTFDVDVIKSSETSVAVEADENLQQYIKTYVKNGNLTIETDQDRCISSSNRIKVTVKCPLVETVVLTGTGDVSLFDFAADYFNVTLSGTGDILLSRLVVSKSLEVNLTGSGNINIDGKSVSAHYYLSGSGDIMAKSMYVSSCKAVLSGTGDIFASVNDTFEIILSGTGYVYYYGNPTVNQRVTGTGKIVKY